jgi:hypothetical protein
MPEGLQDIVSGPLRSPAACTPIQFSNNDGLRCEDANSTRGDWYEGFRCDPNHTLYFTGTHDTCVRMWATV